MWATIGLLVIVFIIFILLVVIVVVGGDADDVDVQNKSGVVLQQESGVVEMRSDERPDSSLWKQDEIARFNEMCKSLFGTNQNLYDLGARKMISWNSAGSTFASSQVVAQETLQMIQSKGKTESLMKFYTEIVHNLEVMRFLPGVGAKDRLSYKEIEDKAISQNAVQDPSRHLTAFDKEYLPDCWGTHRLLW